MYPSDYCRADVSTQRMSTDHGEGSLAYCLECLALCFVAAVRVGAGAAYIDLACGTFAVVAVVNAVVYIAVDTVNSFLLHLYIAPSAAFCYKSIMCMRDRDNT